MSCGKFFLFLKEQVYSTSVFTGDITPERYGAYGLLGLQSVTSPEELLLFAKRFAKMDTNHLDVEAGLVYETGRWTYAQMLDMRENFEEKYGKGYSFIKNSSGKMITFINRSGVLEYTLGNWKTGVLRDGEISKEYAEVINQFKQQPHKDVLSIEDLSLNKTDLHYLIDHVEDRDIIGVSTDWKEVAYQHAYNHGVISSLNEKYFDYDIYIRDLQEKEEMIMELPSGKILLLREQIDENGCSEKKF